MLLHCCCEAAARRNCSSTDSAASAWGLAQNIGSCIPLPLLVYVSVCISCEAALCMCVGCYCAMPVYGILCVCAGNAICSTHF
jgi:hypothetical protein